MSKLVKHAKREMELVGLFDKDSDYNGMIGNAVMRAVKVWNKEGHSGFSHGLALSVFNKVINFKPLSPITFSEEEWTDVGEGLWQNKRNSEAFSHDGGKTYYVLNEVMDVYGCSKCGISFSGHHPIVIDEDEKCETCSKPFQMIKKGKTEEDAMHIAKEPKTFTADSIICE